MRKHWWVPGTFGAAAKVCLGLAMWLGIPMQALAAFHPVRVAQPRALTARHGRRAPVRISDDAGAPKSSRGTRRSAGRRKPAISAPQRAAKPAPKSKRHKQRRDQDADSNPIPLSRVRSHRRRHVARDSAPKLVANKQTAPELKRKVEAPLAAFNKTATAEDFARAAGASAMPQPEIFDRGESHPDDDERLPLTRSPAAGSQQVVATVTAAPEPITPVGKATLQDKLHAVATKAETVVKADASQAKQVLSGKSRVKPSVLPEDHAGKVDVINEAMTPLVLPTLYTRRGRLIVPPPMKGSRDILVHQNLMADSEGLGRIQDDDDLDRLRAKHALVPLVSSNSLQVNGELPLNRRFARPWAARFAADMARGYYARFHTPLRLNSAVRTVEYQIRLQRVNGNAAAVNGDGASPHLTGQALDFGKRGMSTAQIAWMRAYLAPLMHAGKVDVEEEFQQACFHVSVYRSYLPAAKTKAPGRMEVAQDRTELPVPAVAKTEPTLR